MKVPCEVIQDLLPLYEDGVCSEASRALVEEHLSACETCAAKGRAMEAPIEPPPVEVEEQKPLQALKKVVWKRKAAFYCVCTALVVLIGVLVYCSARYGFVSSVPVENVENVQISESTDGSLKLTFQIKCQGEVILDHDLEYPDSNWIAVTAMREWRLFHTIGWEREQLTQGYEEVSVRINESIDKVIFLDTDKGAWITLWERNE